MRTVIYLYEPSTVTIRTKEESDTAAQIWRYGQDAGQPAIGTHQLDSGIYMILSRGALEVRGGHMEVAVLPYDKDIPPDPQVAALALEPGATNQSLQMFLTLAKDISVDDPPGR